MDKDKQKECEDWMEKSHNTKEMAKKNEEKWKIKKQERRTSNSRR